MVDWNGVIYTYAHNYQGDIIGIVDANGTLIVEYKYNTLKGYFIISYDLEISGTWEYNVPASDVWRIW